MTPLAPHITAFLRERLPLQLGASVHTCTSYAYTFQLLFTFASQRLHLQPSALGLEQIDAPLVMEFLAQCETVRGNRASTCNTRLAAIKSFMRFVEYRVPALLEQRWVGRLTHRLSQIERCILYESIPLSIYAPRCEW